MRSIQAVFLDFDGVIIESVDIKGLVFGRLFNQYPEHVDEIVAYHHANGGVSRFEKIRYIYKEILKQQLTEKQFNRLCNDFSRLVFQRVLECDYVPGALEFLDKYCHKVPLFVVSGTPHEEIAEIVKAKKIDNYFRGVFGSPTSKGEWVKKILQEKKTAPQKTLFVGDAMSDYNAALENHVPFVARIKDPEDNIFRDINIETSITDLFSLHELVADG